MPFCWNQTSKNYFWCSSWCPDRGILFEGWARYTGRNIWNSALPGLREDTNFGCGAKQCDQTISLGYCRSQVWTCLCPIGSIFWWINQKCITQRKLCYGFFPRRGTNTSNYSIESGLFYPLGWSVGNWGFAGSPACLEVPIPSSWGQTSRVPSWNSNQKTLPQTGRDSHLGLCR